jgi:hypothetical protein
MQLSYVQVKVSAVPDLASVFITVAHFVDTGCLQVVPVRLFRFCKTWKSVHLILPGLAPYTAQGQNLRS